MKRKLMRAYLSRVERVIYLCGAIAALILLVSYYLDHGHL